MDTKTAARLDFQRSANQSAQPEDEWSADMTWSTQHVNGFAWPPALDTKTYAKANKKGEITAVLGDLDVAHAQWVKITNFPFKPSKADQDKAMRWGKLAADFFTSAPTKKLAGSLEIVAKRAESLEKTKIGSEAKAALKTIRTSAQEHAHSIDPKVVLPDVNKTVRELVEADKQFLLKSLTTVFTQYQVVARKGHPGVRAAKAFVASWPTDDAAVAQGLGPRGAALTSDCRDMTQNLQNLVKIIKYGTDLTQFGLTKRDVETLPKITQTLVPIANPKSAITTDISKAEFNQLVRTVEVNANLYDDIAARMP